MSAPRGRTQLPPNLRNWCKLINSRHCKYYNFLISPFAPIWCVPHHVGSICTTLGVDGTALDTLCCKSISFSLLAPCWIDMHRVGSQCAALVHQCAALDPFSAPQTQFSIILIVHPSSCSTGDSTLHGGSSQECYPAA